MGSWPAVPPGTRGLQCPGPLGARRRGSREAAAQGARCAVTALCCVAVHGAWEDWSPWSLCSVTCGRGARTRTRRCVAPQHGGKACEGPELQAKPCSIATCLGQYHSPLPLLRVPSPGTARKRAESEGCAPGTGAAVMQGSGIAATGTWDSVGRTQGCIPRSGPHGEPAVLQGPGAPTMGMRSHPQSVLHLGWHGNIVGHWGGAGGSRGLWLPVFAQMLCRSHGLQGHPVRGAVMQEEREVHCVHPPSSPRRAASPLRVVAFVTRSAGICRSSWCRAVLRRCCAVAAVLWGRGRSW